MKIALGCDHGGYNYKSTITEHLKKRGIEYIDFGCNTDKSVDYNDYAEPVCDSVVKGECDLGILVCGTGIGMSIVANKIKGIRCAHCQDVFSAKATKLHNNANVLACGERVLGKGLLIEIIDAFIDTPFSNEERHIARVNKIKSLEDRNFK